MPGTLNPSPIEPSTHSERDSQSSEKDGVVLVSLAMRCLWCGHVATVQYRLGAHYRTAAWPCPTCEKSQRVELLGSIVRVS